MAATTPNMGLKVWNLLTDSYDHVQLAENFAKVDQHRHTEGQGAKIPTGGIEDGAISSAKIGNEQVTAEKLGAHSVTPTKISFVTSVKEATGALSTTTEYVDIPGCTYTTASAGTFWVIGTFDISSGSTSGIASGALKVDSSIQAGVAIFASVANGNRASVSNSWIFTAVSGKVIKLQGKKSAGTYTIENPNTRLIVVQIG